MPRAGVLDHAGQRISQASASAGSEPGNGNSAHPAISADGRLVAFSSLASNLVPGAANGFDDIFVRDISGAAGWVWP